MGFPVGIVIILIVGLGSVFPAWRDSTVGLAVSALLLGLGATLVFGYPAGQLSYQWPVLLAFWIMTAWWFVTRLCWRDYHTFRAREGAGTELPDRRVGLGLVASVAPAAAAGVALPLFGVLLSRHLAVLGAPGTLRSGVILITFTLGVVDLIFFVLMFVFVRAKNPWYAMQIKLLAATVSRGDRRQGSFREAMACEPAQ